MRPAGHTAGLFLLDDPDWRRKVFDGGLRLGIPFVGWPMILGYRSALAGALFRSERRLPDWKGHARQYVLEGLRAMCVIFGYLAPLYLLLWFVAVERGAEPGARMALATALFVVFPVFSTLSLPVAVALLTLDGRLSHAEAAAFGIAFAAIIFIVPAGFLQVTRTHRIRSAFALQRTLPFLARNLRAYCRAWVDSIWISTAGHSALPVAPWGVVWAYVAIIHSFNAVLARIEAEDSGTWMAATLQEARGRAHDDLGRRRSVVHLLDAGGERCVVLRFRTFSVPLPRLLERFVA